MRTLSQPSTESSPSSNIRFDIQGLRAIAVLAVVGYHAFLPLPNGFLGVDIFFVISGFVITLTLLRNRKKSGAFDLRSFFTRRFMRLAPAISLMVTVTLIASIFVLSPLGPQQDAALTGISAAVWLANITVALTTGDYFDEPAMFNPLLHTWSLSVEEQFYLVFPLLLLIGFWLTRRRSQAVRGPIFVMCVVGGASLFIFVFRAQLPGALATTQFLGFYSPVPRLWEFLAGAIVALWLVNRPATIGSGPRLLLGAGGLIGSAYAILVPTGPLEASYVGLTLLVALATVALLISGAGDANVISSALSWRPLVKVGDWSYSIYLWHWPFLSLSAVIWPDNAVASSTALAMSFGVAYLSFRFVESPLRRFLPQNPLRLLVFIALVLTIPISLGAAIWHITSKNFGPEIDIATERPIGYRLGCHGPPPVSEELGVCEWRESEEPSALQVYLVGDSNAAHFTAGLLDAQREDGFTLRVMTASACPYLPGLTLVRDGQTSSPECESWREQVRQSLTTGPPGVVILSSSDSYWLDDGWSIIDESGVANDSAAAKQSEFRQSLLSAVSELTSTGHRVILVQTVPHWMGEFAWSLYECSVADLFGGCEASMPLDFSWSRSASVREIVSEVNRLTQSNLLELGPTICPDSICHSYQNGVWVYRNQTHLTNEFSRTLAPVWRETLKGYR